MSGYCVAKKVIATMVTVFNGYMTNLESKPLLIMYSKNYITIIISC